jgi:hypothetical protein
MKYRTSKALTGRQLNVKMTTLRELIRRDVRPPGIGAHYSDLGMESIWTECLKKFSQPVLNDDLDKKAFGLFSQVNRDLGNCKWDLPIYNRYSTLFHSLNQNHLVAAKKWCHVILGDLTTDEWFSACRNSGGSSIGVAYSDTSVEQKFRSPISVTKDASELYLKALFQGNINLWNAVMKYNGQTLSPLGDKSKLFDMVEFSRATTVPKDKTITRMIAIEPTGNMYLQQGLMHVMYDRLRNFGLNVKTLPDRHKNLARKASIDGLNATIDFSSASDCLSIKLIKYLLPDKWYHAVSRIRCSSMKVDSDIQKLNMISTMGNATTFPLETIVFYCLGMAVESCLKKTTLPDMSIRTRVSVFGDDCIVPTSSARRFISLCESVGFNVNKEKSFFSPGPGFRESCGGDFLQGIDVRPLYFKWPSSLKGSGIQAYFNNVYNNLSKKYILYFGDCSYFYKSALRYLREVLQDLGSVLVVPPFMPSDCGLHGDDSRIIKYHSGAKLRTDIHGRVTYNYLRFIYFEQKKVYGAIRLSLWLQHHHKRRVLKGEPSNDKKDPFYPVRSRGSYVVAKGQSVHWTSG